MDADDAIQDRFVGSLLLNNNESMRDVVERKDEEMQRSRDPIASLMQHFAEPATNVQDVYQRVEVDFRLFGAKLLGRSDQSIHSSAPPSNVLLMCSSQKSFPSTYFEWKRDQGSVLGPVGWIDLWREWIQSQHQQHHNQTKPNHT